MKIECRLIREGGTKVEFGPTVYHFKPDPAFGGRHIADVTDEDHISRLLSISEAYKMVKTGTPAPVEPPKNKPPVEPTEPPAPPLPPVDPAVQTDGDGDQTGGDQTGGDKGDGDQTGGDQTGGDKGDGDQTGGGDKQTEADGLDAMDRAALVDLYQARFGSAPPARIGKQGLIAALREKADG